MEKVACYIRVSTEEQKLHGISLDAQVDKLTEYAEKHDLKIVDWYKDEGVSGRKLIRRRPELQRMLNDAQAKKFDRILFIKLDRFFRSVAEYHECMKLIDPVVWTATEEKYDLTTANGRAFVNMKLTIAELEADQTGERIKLVNEYKVKNGQALQGSQCQGFGFCVEKANGTTRVIHDPETEHILKDIINHYMIYQNKTGTVKWLSTTYGINITTTMLVRHLSNRKLYGFYRGNPNYCEPYIDKDTFDRLQELLKRNIKKTVTGRVYLFTGLIRCPACGNKLTVVRNGIKFSRSNYRCQKASVYHVCTFHHTRSEKKIESALLERFDQYVDAYVSNVSIANAEKDANAKALSQRTVEIKSEMKKLNLMFQKGRMSEADYDKEYTALEDELAELEAKMAPAKERDLSAYNELLESDWKSIYNALSTENKRAFWRKYIKEIVMNTEGAVTGLIFF